MTGINMYNAELIECLKKKLLLENTSGKHALYQVLPASLRSQLGGCEYSPGSRYEEERLECIMKKISVVNKSAFDIGCNLGFFTFSFLSMGASKMTSYEGNKNHAEFVLQARELLDLNSKLIVHNDYYDFSDSSLKADVGVLLNVLHHIGDDYGDINTTLNTARELNQLAKSCHELVFQLGFNWRGDRNLPLFNHGTKKEMIDFIESGTQGNWHVDEIFIAERNSNGVIEYCPVNDNNIERDNDLGEFLNRPLFFMKSLSFESN